MVRVIKNRLLLAPHWLRYFIVKLDIGYRYKRGLCMTCENPRQEGYYLCYGCEDPRGGDGEND